MAPVDFRPISITPILSRIMERLVVRQFLPSLPLLSRVTGILGPVRLSTHRFHHLCPGLVPSYHNPVAYSTWLRHCASIRFQQSLWHCPALRTLFDKLARLDLPDHVYNWLVDFFNGHSHCTRFESKMSSFTDISTSIIQGSAIGPASYVVHAALRLIFRPYTMFSTDKLLTPIPLCQSHMNLLYPS